MMDLQEAFDEGFEAVKDYVDGAMAALGARIAEIETRQAQSASVDILSQINRAVSDAVALIPAVEAKEVDHLIVAEMVAKAVADIPPAKAGEPGKSVTVEDLAPLVADEVAKATAGIQAPSVDWSEVDKIIGDRLGAAVEALPKPENGKDADPAEMRAAVVAEVEKAVAKLAVPKDGVGLAGALIDRSGCLVVTLTDGSTKDLGRVVGKDVDPEAVDAFLRAEVAKLPVPKDGLGFEDLDLREVDGYLYLRFERGADSKEFHLPVPVDQGVWAEREFKKGAAVTWAGSSWIAQRSTSAKPDTPDSGWRLAVKRGRDGKQGQQGKQGEPGKKGDPGTPGRNYS